MTRRLGYKTSKINHSHEALISYHPNKYHALLRTSALQSHVPSKKSLAFHRRRGLNKTMETNSSAAAASRVPLENKHHDLDIFLCHCGRQKGFVADLHDKLSLLDYSVFFDKKAFSIPPGAPFPSYILSTAHACKLAVVVISEGFVTSKWPLLELCSFVDRHLSTPSFTILPLFFELSPSDMRADENVKRWRIRWEEFEERDDSLSAAKCEAAVKEILPELSGVERRPEWEQGEVSYIEDVIKKIRSILDPSDQNKHDIFLCHSGKQKGFVRDLHNRISSVGYSVFLDEKDGSLPPGKAYPDHIISAAQTCKLAIVVLSADFLTSRWPLIELCSFVDRMNSRSPHASDTPFAILPLFFKLSPTDFQLEENRRRWIDNWERLESEKEGVSAAKCEQAVMKVLLRINGVIMRPESEQGQASYIDDIMRVICMILSPPRLARQRYETSAMYIGLDRLRQVILDKFGELEDPHYASRSEGNLTNPCCILGMHGVSGSGKSTLCGFLCDSMYDEFMGKAIHLELPTELRGDHDPRIKRQYLKLLSFLSPQSRYSFASMNLAQLDNRLREFKPEFREFRYKFHEFGSEFPEKMFLVLDNISPSNYGSYEKLVKSILKSDALGSRSRVMLVSRSSDILEKLLQEVNQRYTIIEIPQLTKEEAMAVIRHRSETKDAIPRVLDDCKFPSSSFMNLPFVCEQIGVLLRENQCTDLNELELLWKMAEERKEAPVQKLVGMNMKQLPRYLRDLFLDITLFVIPAGFSRLSEVTSFLCTMNDINNASKLKEQIMKLVRHCALSFSCEELNVHDVLIEYAKNLRNK